MDIMVILLMEGKTNQEGKIQYCGAMRNKNWEACPLGAMAMWLFYRLAKESGRLGRMYLKRSGFIGFR